MGKFQFDQSLYNLNYLNSLRGSTLQQTLTGMFAKNFNNSTSFGMSFRIPLKVSIGMFEHGVQFITLQFIGREHSHSCWIIDKGFINEVSDGKHTRCF